jgi:hypothetical protein
MAFSETIFPPGKILYKGLENLSCRVLLRDTRFFYLTESQSHAKNYGNVCKFRVKRTMRLFDLTHANIERLVRSSYPLSPGTRGLLRVVLGTGVTVGEQALAAKILMGDRNAGTLPSIRNTRPGQRLSYKNLNREVFGKLTREFLIPEGYDGYYAPKKPSIFHGGSFHSEIMISNAYQTIENMSGPAPVVTRRSFKWALPRMFTEFCKGTTRLVREYGGGLTIFCTGGMAVRLYLGIRRKSLPPKIRRTADFDFTFALPRKLRSDAEVASYVYTMRKIMTDHLNAFVRYLNRNYEGINARLKVNKFARSKWDNPRLQVPGTDRKIYQVISYQIITGHGEVIDLVDTALAVYPNSSREMLHLPYSYKLGIPIQRLRYQLKDSLALLSGSFIHGGLIAGRNPLSGVVKEKGLKNVERVDQLLKVIKSRRKYYRNLGPVSKAAKPFLNAIALKNMSAARKTARGVNKVMKKIK